MSLEITRLAETIAFKPAEIESINAARKQIEGIHQVMTRTACDQPHASRHEHFSWLHHEVDRLAQVLHDEPTHANAEALNSAIARFDQSTNSATRIHETLHAACRNVSLQLAGIVSALFDKVEKTINEGATQRREEIANSANGLFSNSEEKRLLEVRVSSLLAELQATRKEAASDPLGFLEREGLAL